MYNYREAVTSDLLDWMEENRELWADMERYEAYEKIYDLVWVDDSVTGNASGSYTFNRYQARENFFGDDDSEAYLDALVDEGLLDHAQIGKWVAEENWETIDVCIRCHLVGECLEEVLDRANI